MKIKLDENIDVRLAPMIAASGHEVDTVKAEGLSGEPDETIYETCRAGGRVVVTLDLDFSNPHRFDPTVTEGIVVLRVPRPLLPIVRATVLQVLPLLETHPLQGKLWIVEPGRIRVYDPAEESD
jgi:predicted nuclease of predicted toxin-antitoxin system